MADDITNQEQQDKDKCYKQWLKLNTENAHLKEKLEELKLKKLSPTKMEEGLRRIR